MKCIRCVTGALMGFCIALLCGTTPAVASTATYTATETIPVPPASNFQGSGGGDGWAVALSSTQVFNVFHHNGTLQVACHNQSDASNCWPDDPSTIVDGSGNSFTTSGQPGLYLDRSTGKLYVYATRSSDTTGGVVCVDVSNATADPAFCGFTALTAVGEASGDSFSALSDAMQVGTKLYSFNYVTGAGVTGTKNKLLCFDLTTDAACSGQPYTVSLGLGSATMATGLPSPSTAAIAGKLFIPVSDGSGTDLIACWDPSSSSDCAGSWPLNPHFTFAGIYGAPFAMLDGSGATTGICLPDGSVDCYDLSGATVVTPSGLAAALSTGSSPPWEGPGLVLGPRVYVPEWPNVVACYDYSTGASCAGFPKTFANLDLLYTVNPDPQRPTCLWVNSDDGTYQIQNFDAYTGGACGQGSIRVLASQFVVNTPLCTPASYQSIQVLDPAPTAYNPTGSTVEFDDGDATKIATISPNPANLDSTGSVSLVGDGLNSATGLPQFLFTLNGVSGTPSSVEVELTWTGTFDPSCVGPNTTVTGGQDNDLALQSMPSNITTNATGKTGATVTYTPPTAGDEAGDSTTATVKCDRPSGSVFPIGTSMVTCTATDADDSNSPVTGTFQVTVRGALAQLQDLEAYVNGLPPGTSLPDKVHAAVDFLRAGDNADTCFELTAIINEATAQSGKKLTVTQSDSIITSANRIRAVLGC